MSERVIHRRAEKEWTDARGRKQRQKERRLGRPFDQPATGRQPSPERLCPIRMMRLTAGADSTLTLSACSQGCCRCTAAAVSPSAGLPSLVTGHWSIAAAVAQPASLLQSLRPRTAAVLSLAQCPSRTDCHHSASGLPSTPSSCLAVHSSGVGVAEILLDLAAPTPSIGTVHSRCEQCRPCPVPCPQLPSTTLHLARDDEPMRCGERGRAVDTHRSIGRGRVQRRRCHWTSGCPSVSDRCAHPAAAASLIVVPINAALRLAPSKKSAS